MPPGALWHGMLLGLAGRLRHAAAAVPVGALRRSLELHYHGLGGALSRRVEGAGRYAWLGAEQALLPGRIDRYPLRALNEELYFWLGAFLACDRPLAGEEALPAGVRHLLRGAATSARVLREFPGLRLRYRRLCAAELALRAAALPGWDAQARHPVLVLEAAMRHALGDARPPRHPWLARALEAACSGVPLPPSDAAWGWLPYLPVPLWGHEGAAAWRPRLLPFRRRVRRRTEGAVKSLARPRLEARGTAPVRGAPAHGAWSYPEWDWRQRAYRADWCKVEDTVPTDAGGASFGAAAAARGRALRAQFEALRQQPAWSRPRESGDELDIDAYVDAVADARGCGHGGARVYRQRARRRDALAVALLADRSRSTEAWVGEQRVIDLERDAMLALAEALAASGDDFGLFAFASDSRLRVRSDRIKGFDEAYDAAARRRMLALRAGQYTRMGAAVRHVAAQLARRPAEHKLLLVLTDGRPYDPADGYDGRYAVEDTRRALLEARWRGLHCFGLAIDQREGGHLAHLFGTGHFAVLSEPGALPRVLPRLYARLTLGPH
jgi:nitric oxide reductase NorD protein